MSLKEEIKTVSDETLKDMVLERYEVYLIGLLDEEKMFHDEIVIVQ